MLPMPSMRGPRELGLFEVQITPGVEASEDLLRGSSDLRADSVTRKHGDAPPGPFVGLLYHTLTLA